MQINPICGSVFANKSFLDCDCVLIHNETKFCRGGSFVSIASSFKCSLPNNCLYHDDDDDAKLLFCCYCSPESWHNIRRVRGGINLWWNEVEIIYIQLNTHSPFMIQWWFIRYQDDDGEKCFPHYTRFYSKATQEDHRGGSREKQYFSINR